MKYPKMDPGVKTKWLTALRSRKYKQVRETLFSDTEAPCGSYCCLGVLCDISGLGEFKASGTYITPAGWSDNNFIPSDISEWAALERSTQEELAFMNDSGKKFYQIARWIERNL